MKMGRRKGSRKLSEIELGREGIMCRNSVGRNLEMKVRKKINQIMGGESRFKPGIIVVILYI